jgi:hypothetical protein
VGTLIYRACAGDDRAVYLLRSDRTAYRLSDVRPDLAAKVRTYGFEGASLSYDAQYLGLRVGTGYEIHQLTGEKSVFTFEPGPRGSHWEVVGLGHSVAQRDARGISGEAAHPVRAARARNQ